MLALAKPRCRVPARIKPRPAPVLPAGARLLDYFGLGAQLAVTSGGMAIAVQADHLVETVRVVDIVK